MMTKGNHTMSAAPRISFEFFPPQSLEASFRLWDTVQTLAPMQPGFVSVTYGAGGTTRKLTHDAVATIHKNYGLNVAAHLTCVDATREETLEIVNSYAKAGVTEIVAVLHGEMELLVEGEWRPVAAGQALRFAADRPHGYRNLGEQQAVFHNVIRYPARRT